MKKNDDPPAITLTLTRAGRCVSGPVTLTGKEFEELARFVRSARACKPKHGPKTQAQAEASALFENFVRGGMR